MNRKTFSTAAIAAISLAASVQAAPVTWGSAFDTLSGASVNNSGSLVSAVNAGHTVGAPIAITSDFENITFIGSGTAPLGGSASGMRPGAVSTMESIVNTVSVGGGVSTSFGLTGLTAGRLYQVQVFFTDERVATPGRVMTFGSIGGNSVAVAGDSGANGQTAIGVFKADAATQSITISTATAANAHVNAYTVRDITEPLRNGSFELDGNFDFDVAGWTEVGQVFNAGPTRSNIQTRNDGAGPPSDGSVILQFNGGSLAPGGGVHRDFSTVIDQVYRLTFDFGKSGAGEGTAALDVIVTDGAGLGGLVLLSQSISDSTNNGFASFEYYFTAQGLTSNIYLLDATTGAALAFDGIVDAVNIIAVPAPAAMPAGLAMIALIAMRRRRNR